MFHSVSSQVFLFFNIECVDCLMTLSLHAEPEGVLIDSAMKLVFPYIPEVSVEERREALARASDHALSRGVTAVVDLGRYFPGASPELSWADLSGSTSKYFRILIEGD